METLVQLEGVNGEWFTLAGPGAGDRGVYLGTDVKGIYDPPVKLVTEEPGNHPGSRYLSHRILKRDITFGVEILNDAPVGPKSWLSRESEWRKAWAFDKDCKLYVTTPDSGTRYLKLRLAESPEVDMFYDPRGNKINRTVMVCVALDPFWYEDDVVYAAVTQEDTTFDPNDFGWPLTYDDLPKETLTIHVAPGTQMADGRINQGGLNPTDNIIWPKWILPGSTEAPAEPYVPGIPWLGAPKSPQVVWVVPDYSFEDESQANRRVRMPGLIGGLRTEEVQRIQIDGRPTGGTFKLGDGNGEWTSGIAYNASANDVRLALISGFSWIGPGDVTVKQEAATNEQQTIRLTGGPVDGTFTLTFDGETTAPIPFNASASQLKSALQALDAIGYMDVHVEVDSTNEVQRVEIVGEPTGGTFKLGIGGYWTDPIPYNATTIQVAAELNKLPFVGTFDVLVTGESLFLWGPYKITFIGDLGGLNLNQLEADGSDLTGGADADVRVTTITEGDRIYHVTFRGDLAGLNLPEMTGDPSGLINGYGEGEGPECDVVIETTVQGERPYVVTFTGELSGVDVPKLEIDTSELTGGSPTGRVMVATEGHTAPAENALVDTDPRVEQVSSESGSQLWARMNGVRFHNPIPPYTYEKTFELTVSGAKPGQMVVLRLPRAWTRPWGLE